MSGVGKMQGARHQPAARRGPPRPPGPAPGPFVPPNGAVGSGWAPSPGQAPFPEARAGSSFVPQHWHDRIDATAKQDVAWVAPNFQLPMALAFRCLERDQSPTTGCFQVLGGSAGLTGRG